MSSQKDFCNSVDCHVNDVLAAAFERGKLPNSNIIVCDDISVCREAVQRAARQILKTIDLENCVDFVQIVPFGVMAQISVEQIRELIPLIYMSPKTGEKKVVAIFNADRMNSSSANAFLKTLEEPPADTIIFLTTPKLHLLLPTIISRCSVTRLPSLENSEDAKELKDWLAGYGAWLGSLFDSECIEKNNAVMQMYSLLSKLEEILNWLVEDRIDNADDSEFSSKLEIYQMLLLKIENKTSEFFRQNQDYLKFLPEVVAILERDAALLKINANFMTCVEAFFVETFMKIVKL